MNLIPQHIDTGLSKSVCLFPILSYVVTLFSFLKQSLEMEIKRTVGDKKNLQIIIEI